MSMLNEIYEKIKKTNVFKMIEKFFASFNVEGSRANVYKQDIDGYTSSHKEGVGAHGLSIGERVANKINKLLKKYKKKFKNEEKSMGAISKIVNGVIKAACIAATVVFGAMVVYMFIKIIPTIIFYVAMAFATVISIELILNVVGNALGTNF